MAKVLEPHGPSRLATAPWFHALLEPRRKLALKIVISATLVAWLVYATDREALADALIKK